MEKYHDNFRSYCPTLPCCIQEGHCPQRLKCDSDSPAVRQGYQPQWLKPGVGLLFLESKSQFTTPHPNPLTEI